MSDQLVYTHDCTASPITTTAYTEIVASAPTTFSHIQFGFFQATGNGAQAFLARGESGAEQDILSNSIFALSAVPYYIEKGTRLSLKAIGATISTGYLIVSLVP